MSSAATATTGVCGASGQRSFIAALFRCCPELVVAEARNGEIFWVEGLRIGERFKLDKGTRRALKWCWRRR
jgi:hypothetical protein